ncbi:MAG: hypothetical protein J2P21_32950 [Chloracidobacterium sp.]|nr:hypothetical protein [Chloracidobacterium sp.]
MTKSELAAQLRQRQLEKGLVPKWMVEILDDDAMIDSYVTCPECGVKQAEGAELERIISTSSGAEDFFDRCDEAAKGRSHTFSHWPDEIELADAKEE